MYGLKLYPMKSVKNIKNYVLNFVCKITYIIKPNNKFNSIWQLRKI